MSPNTSLLLYALLAVGGLVVSIARFKLNAFVALILASLFMGLCSGMELGAIATGFQDGVGAVLGSVAIVVGLGTILGKMLAESGGVHVVATTFIRVLGEHRVHWTMMLVAFIVGIPVFFSVGLMLLIPITFALAKYTRTSLLYVGVPLLAGLSVAHGLVPPHPGPMVAIELFDADVGTTIFYSLLVGFPTAVIAGPLFGTFISRRVRVEPSGALAGQLTHEPDDSNAPGFGVTMVTILLPVGLMLLATVADLTLVAGHPVRPWAAFVGHPVVALLVAVLFSFYSFGVARGYSREQILAFTNDCVAPIAAILLVVGAGGGFNRVLVNSGVGTAIAELVNDSPVPVVLLGWVVAALIRVATGSATVAITTAAGIMAPIAAASAGVHIELLVLAMGAGSLVLSHVNDAGFWLVKECFNMTVTETLKTWTVMETLLSVVALAFILLLDVLI